MSRVVSNRRQLTRLVELMQQNLDIANTGYCSKSTAQTKWETFAEDLNSLGPPTRDWQKWQRVWTDLKCKIKKKALEVGGNRKRLHHLEETVVQVLEHKRRLSSPPPPSNVFVSIPGKEFQLEDRSMPGTSSELNDVDVGPSIKQEFDETYNETPSYVQQMDSAKQQFYETITILMGDIRRSMKNMEFFAKKTFQQKRKHNADILKLKRTKLILYKHNLKLKIDILKHQRQNKSLVDPSSASVL